LNDCVPEAGEAIDVLTHRYVIVTGPVAATVATPVVDPGQLGPTYVGGLMVAFTIDTAPAGSVVRVRVGVAVCATGVVAGVAVGVVEEAESGSGEIAGKSPGDRRPLPPPPRLPKARNPTPTSTPIATTAAATMSAMGRRAGTSAISTVSSGCGGN
jgi:hypothetical protein